MGHLKGHSKSDVIIIGGGINGAGIAHDASLRGLKVLLLEQHEVAAGASSKTSKLAHGGLRYLEQFNFKLVKESLRERNILLDIASDYVTPLRFLYPVYSHSKRPLWQLKMGMKLYDFLASPSPLPPQQFVSAAQIQEQCPLLKQTDLKGGCFYYDAQMQDTELVTATMAAAQAAGAQVIEHARVDSFIKDNDRIMGVQYQDQEGKTVCAHAAVVVNVTGAWSNQIVAADRPQAKEIVQPSKGVHLIVPALPYDNAFILEAPQDGRHFFVMPWLHHSLIGTTDTLYDGDLDDVQVRSEDSHYLLEATRFYFPEWDLHEEDIDASFAGCRPLAKRKKYQIGPSITRDFVIHESKSGLLSMVGGKYTTFRYMAECMVDKIVTQFPKNQFKGCDTKHIGPKKKGVTS